MITVKINGEYKDFTLTNDLMDLYPSMDELTEYFTMMEKEGK